MKRADENALGLRGDWGLSLEKTGAAEIWLEMKFRVFSGF